MKILVFSDTHLTSQFDRKKFEFLKGVINTSDMVIINGDFWDSDYTSYQEFISSDWKKLFLLLKEREVVYIAGNHDPLELIDSGSKNFFTSVVKDFSIHTEEALLYFAHGDFYRTKSSSLLKIKNNLKKISFLKEFYRRREVFLIRTQGDGYFSRKYLNSNNKQRLWKKKNLPKKSILVTSHTHRPEFRLKGGYINTGVVCCGYAQYLTIEIEGDKLGKVSLKKVHY